MEFFVDKWTIQGRAARCKPITESDTMKETIFDILTAVGVGLALLPLALAYFDVLTY